MRHNVAVNLDSRARLVYLKSEIERVLLCDHITSARFLEKQEMDRLRSESTSKDGWLYGAVLFMVLSTVEWKEMWVWADWYRVCEKQLRWESSFHTSHVWFFRLIDETMQPQPWTSSRTLRCASTKLFSFLFWLDSSFYDVYICWIIPYNEPLKVVTPIAPVYSMRSASLFQLPGENLGLFHRFEMRRSVKLINSALDVGPASFFASGDQIPLGRGKHSNLDNAANFITW
jgi:hypothetical protein